MPDGPLNPIAPSLPGFAREGGLSHSVDSTPSFLIRRRPDIVAVAVLLGLSALLVWHRLWLWNGLAYLDVATFYMPWYAFLGQHLRELQIPAWNPHLFSGVPFTGDPQSGWMYLPAMVFFTILNPLAAYKAFLIFHLLMAGLSTYAFARVVGVGAFGSLAAAIAFEFGPFSSHIACCLILVQLAVWIPPALLGVEMASRTDRWSARLGWWSITAVAVSQMAAAWVGQGIYNGVLLVGAYIVFRQLVSVRIPATFKERVIATVAGGSFSIGLGLALGAAGLLPRLDAVRETNLSGGQYSGTGINDYSGPWELSIFLRRTFGDHNGYNSLLFYLGATTLSLTFMGPFILRRRLAAPFFFGLTMLTAFLTLRTTPIHQLFYLLPKYETLQEHVPSRILAVQWIGPAMLTGAVIDQLRRGWVPPRLLKIAAIPIVVWAVVMVGLFNYTDSFGADTILVVLATCLVVGAFVFIPTIAKRWRRLTPGRLQQALSLALLVLVLWDPAGRLFLHAVLNDTTDPVVRLPDGIATNSAIAANMSATDAGGAGEFLQSATSDGALWRFFGYDDALQYGGAKWPSTYREWYFTPEAIALLINARAMPLSLSDAQGYNPVQLKGYVEFLNVLNQGTQNYHDAQILPNGLLSPLLNLLNVRYIVVPNDLPAGRPRLDLLSLLTTHAEVFSNDQIRVFENKDALPRAWVVHDVIRADRATQLTILSNEQIDPKTTAMIAGASAAPSAITSGDSSGEAVTVTGQETDSITLSANLASDGIVVVSQSYANGWKAYIDGNAAPLYLTDGVLQGIPTTAGVHTIELKYEPKSLRMGLWITGISGVLLAGVWVYAFANRKQAVSFS